MLDEIAFSFLAIFCGVFENVTGLMMPLSVGYCERGNVVQIRIFLEIRAKLIRFFRKKYKDTIKMRAYMCFFAAVMS